jgi:hypothetical protein
MQMTPSCEPVDIVAVAMAIKAMDDDSRRRQMVAMACRRSSERKPVEWEAGPLQENAIRIMDDMTA